MTSLYEVIRFNEAVPTWFGVGGRADRLAAPTDEEMARDCVLAFAGHTVRVLGDGANLLVEDGGVDGVVLDLCGLDGVEVVADEGDREVLRVGAGKRLPRLVVQTVREGLSGLEHLGGIPASVGGAAVMNAGGAFGEIAGAVRAVHALTTTGTRLCIPREEIAFGYRVSGLEHLIVTAVDFELERVAEGERGSLRQRLKDVMSYKKGTQPLADASAGCCFKNPAPGVGAGALIDSAGCKGLRVGGAEVSHKHANFVVTHDGCTAGDVLELMDEVEARVRHASGVSLEREVKVWGRGSRR
jgi:UDP-N-acetylmuramate dehydrogenase